MSEHPAAPVAETPAQSLLRIITPVKGRLIGAISLGAVGAIARVIALVASGFLVQRLLDGAPVATVAWWVIGIVLAMVASAVAATLASVLSHQAAFDHEVIMRRDLAQQLGRLPLGVVQRIGSGGVKKIFQGDVRGLHAAVADSPPMLGAAIGGMLFSLIALGLIQWRLLLVVLALLPLLFFVISLSMKDYREERAAYDASGEAIDAASVEYVQGMQEVRMFDGGSESFGRYAEYVTQFTRHLRAWTDRTKGASLATRLIIAPLPVTILVACAGFAMAAAGWFNPVDVVVALLIASLPVDSVMPIAMLTDYNLKATASAARITQILDLPVLDEPSDPRIPADASIEFEDVTFAYDPTRAPALDHLTLTVPAGSVCALVGPSGSGKSTVARLIPRFFDVGSGQIRIGGVDVRDISSQTLLNTVALVFQDPFLLHASIWDNLTLGTPAATRAEVEDACRAARVHDEIIALPHGYDSPVSERGTSLSGGQRQRITIARALIANTPIVILDEATAFTDPENEAAIQDAIAELTRERTVIVIAHRLATIRDADQIVVLDRGRVSQSGTHDELIADGGLYAALWDRHEQAQGWGIRTGAAR